MDPFAARGKTTSGHPLDDVDVQRLRLKPNDVVLVRLGPTATVDRANEIAEKMAAVFPNNKTLIVCGDVELAVVEPEAA